MKIKKFNGGINAELDIVAENQKDMMTGYCEKCGALIIHKEGIIRKFDDGTWQQLFCSHCDMLQTERQFSHV